MRFCSLIQNADLLYFVVDDEGDVCSSLKQYQLTELRFHSCWSTTNLPMGVVDKSTWSLTVQVSKRTICSAKALLNFIDLKNRGVEIYVRDDPGNSYNNPTINRCERNSRSSDCYSWDSTDVKGYISWIWVEPSSSSRPA